MSVMCEKSRPVMTRRHSTTSLASSSRCDCFIRFALALSGSAGLLVAELATSFRLESGPQSSTEGVDGTDESSWSFDGGSVPGSCAEGPVSVSGSDAVSDSASVSDAGADFRLRIANRPPAASARLFFPSNRSICLSRAARARSKELSGMAMTVFAELTPAWAFDLGSGSVATTPDSTTARRKESARQRS